MKELTTEEKAKAYDEALKVLHKYDGANIIFSQSLKEEMFPELAESEDERIRKHLIKHFGNKSKENWNGVPTKSILAWLEKQGERKPADKVEPKFREGDWVFIEEVKGYKNGPFQIKNVDSFGYSFDEYHTIPFMYEELLSKWTIQDAKYGDILANNENWIVIFHSLDGIKSEYPQIKGYAGLISGSDVVLHTDMFPIELEWNPATKEQCEQLKKAMADAGYVWDEEKKELKKINWNPQPGDTFRKKGTESPIYHLCSKREDGIHFGFVEERENGVAGGEISIFALKNEYELVERLKPIEKVIEEEFNRITELKPSWSEEDKDMCYKVTAVINRLCAEGKDYVWSIKTLKKLFYWLKSLKDRIIPQPKQEWSGEDNAFFKAIIRDIENIQYISEDAKKDRIKWFKSLKERYT